MATHSPVEAHEAQLAFVSSAAGGGEGEGGGGEGDEGGGGGEKGGGGARGAQAAAQWTSIYPGLSEHCCVAAHISQLSFWSTGGVRGGEGGGVGEGGAEGGGGLKPPAGSGGSGGGGGVGGGEGEGGGGEG